MTQEQLRRLGTLPRYYTVQHLVDEVFAGDHDAFVDAWVSRVLPPAVRKTCAELVSDATQQVWLLQRILAVLLAGQAPAPRGVGRAEPPG